MFAETDNNFLESMASMSDGQLAEVEKRLAALRSVGGSSKPQVVDNWLETEYSRTLANVTGNRIMPAHVLLRNKGDRAILDNLRTFIETQFGTKNKLEHIKIARLFFRLVVEDCRKWNGDQGPKKWAPALLSRMKAPNEVFDKHFPGYFDAGLLRILVRRDSSRVVG